MRKTQTQRLISCLHLKGKGSYVSTATLAATLDVSVRQVQKYIASLNKDHTPPYIISNREGHTLNPNLSNHQLAEIEHQASSPEAPETRKNYILQKLTSPEGYNIFDLSDELYVSISTIEADLQQIRRRIQKHNLYIQRNKEVLNLVGEEQGKRRMMLELLHNLGYDTFVLNDALHLLRIHWHLPNLIKKVREIFQINEIYVNDYALNNILLHLIIMVERIGQHCEIHDNINLEQHIRNSSMFTASAEIIRYVERRLYIKVNDAELQNFALLVMNCSSSAKYSDISTGNISQYIQQEYLQVTKEVLQLAEKSYSLEPFNEEFTTTFALHLKNLILRSLNNYQINNSLTENIKGDYPFIYDIAVFVGQIISEKYSVSIIEDEITFIAFHIGSYFENNVSSINKVSCVFVYVDYNVFFQKQVNRILEVFGNALVVLDILPLEDFNNSLPDIDLVISMANIPIHAPKVILDPFLSKKDLQRLDHVIENVLSQKKAQQIRNYLTQLFQPETFYPHLTFSSREEIIHFMCDDIIAQGYACQNFKKDVFARESMSPTVFNYVAVPHTVNKSAKESFFAFGLCDKPILWDGTTEVSLILLIGINDDSRKIFAQVFDYLIGILSEPLNVQKLLNEHSYDDFLDMLIKIFTV